MHIEIYFNYIFFDVAALVSDNYKTFKIVFFGMHYKLNAYFVYALIYAISQPRVLHS